MGLDEAVTFMDEKREHFKEGLFVNDDITESINFTESPAVNKCLTGCAMCKDEALRLGGTVFGKVFDNERKGSGKDEEEGVRRGTEQATTTTATIADSKDDYNGNSSSSAITTSGTDTDEATQEDGLSGSDEDGSGDDGCVDGDDDVICVDASFGGEERDTTEAVDEPYSNNLEYLKDQFTIIENKILYKVYLNKSKDNDSFDTNKISPKLLMRECAAKVRIVSACVAKRLARTAEAEGAEQPRLEVLARDHGLDQFEKSVLLLLVGMMISDEVRRAWEAENKSYMKKSFTVGSIFDYLCRSLQERIESRKYFYCGARLIRGNMVQVYASLKGSVTMVGSDLDECNIEIDRRLFDYMYDTHTRIHSHTLTHDTFTHAHIHSFTFIHRLHTHFFL